MGAKRVVIIMRVTIVTNIPAPYRQPLYQSIDQRLRTRGGALTVIYGAVTTADRQWKVDAGSTQETSSSHGPTSVFVRNATLKLGRRTTYVTPLVARALARTSPDVAVIAGYAPWTYWAVAWCRRRSIPILLWSGETPAAASAEGYHRIRRSALIRAVDGGLAYSSYAAEYMSELGCESDAITVLGNGIDYSAFTSEVETARRSRAATRSRYGLTGPTILSVGGKGLQDIERAMRSPALNGVHILVAGDKKAYESPRMVATGKLPRRDMPALYACSDLLVHLPPYDRWPHAINEALAAGLPLVASPRTGVPQELLHAAGATIVEPKDSPALVNAIVAMVEESGHRSARLGVELRQQIERWNVDAMSERFIEAVQCVKGVSTIVSSTDEDADGNSER